MERGACRRRRPAIEELAVSQVASPGSNGRYDAISVARTMGAARVPEEEVEVRGGEGRGGEERLACVAGGRAARRWEGMNAAAAGSPIVDSR